MISELSFKNFKSWQNFENVKFSAITAFFGTNSSGKTSIIDFLLLLKQTIESSDRSQVLEFGDINQYRQLGSFRDIIYNHETSRELKFEIKLNFSENIKISDPEIKNKDLFADNKLIFATEISQGKKRIYVQEMTYQFDEQKFKVRKQEKDKYDYILSSESSNIGKRHNFKRAPGRAWSLPEPNKFYGFPDQTRTYYQNTDFLFDLQLTLENTFSKIYYLGPLREYPKREYSWTGARPSDMGRRGERFLDALLASRINEETISRGYKKKRLTVEEYVAYWLKELGIIDSFSIEEIASGSNIYQVKVKRNPESASVLLTDVGFGVSQILPILTLCYYVPEGSTIIIEQPEIHLHPKIQSGLADVFIDAIEKKKIQIVLESHSEHLLRRLQRRISEEAINSNRVSAYFCKNEKSESVIESLEIDEYGNIRNWPLDFFGNEMEEISAITKANIKRKSI
ncbi:DUF3696 domain-containing protein (plasmid) [Leptospira sp. WS92.C1]